MDQDSSALERAGDSTEALMLSPVRTSGRIKSTGVLLLLLGFWGAVVPFVGPTFGYDMGGASAWTWSESHASLHLAPGLAAILGGALLLGGGKRATQTFGAGIATLGGIWFVIGPSLHPLWAGQSMGGMIHMGETALSSALSALGYHYGTGAAISVVGAYALGVLVASGGVAADVDRTTSQADRRTAPEPSLVAASR